MERLPKIRQEEVSKERYIELIRRPDTRNLLNSLIFARVIVELGLNPRDIYRSEFTDEKDSLMGCLIILPVSRSREELVQKLQNRFSWDAGFRELRTEDYEDIVDMSSDIWSFMGEWELLEE